MKSFVVTCTYKEMGVDKIPFLCKEKFLVSAGNLTSAKKKADKILFKAHGDEYTIEDICTK